MFLTWRIRLMHPNESILVAYSYLAIILLVYVAVLVGLYEEPDRPVNAVDYIKRYMGAPANVDVEALKNDNQELKAEVMDLKKTVEELKATVGETKGEVQRR